MNEGWDNGFERLLKPAARFAVMSRICDLRRPKSRSRAFQEEEGAVYRLIPYISTGFEKASRTHWFESEEKDAGYTEHSCYIKKNHTDSTSSMTALLPFLPLVKLAVILA